MAGKPVNNTVGQLLQARLVSRQALRKFIHRGAEYQGYEDSQCDADQQDEYDGQRHGQAFALQPIDGRCRDGGKEQRKQERHNQALRIAHPGQNNEQSRNRQHRIAQPWFVFECHRFFSIKAWLIRGDSRHVISSAGRNLIQLMHRDVRGFQISRLARNDNKSGFSGFGAGPGGHRDGNHRPTLHDQFDSDKEADHPQP